MINKMLPVPLEEILNVSLLKNQLQCQASLFECYTYFPELTINPAQINESESKVDFSNAFQKCYLHLRHHLKTDNFYRIKSPIF